jgi:HPr kinase/phosphorylase
MGYVKVRELVEDTDFDLALRLVSGAPGLSRQIKYAYVQKPGLALAGYTNFVVPSRIQLLGKTEISYLRTLGEEERARLLAGLFECDFACLILSRDLPVLPGLLTESERAGIPVLVTPHTTQYFIQQVTRFLENRFAETTSSHGVLCDVFGVGILILGRPGIGKSECALDLILRGHRLVADDIVDLVRIPPSTIYGSGPELIKYHMEIRGLGIINIKELFGISAIRDRKKVQMVVQLVDWDEKLEYDRIGLDESVHEILGTKLPTILLPVRPGRHLTSIIEVACRNYLLKMDGYHAAQEFQKNLLRQIQLNRPMRIVGEEVE